MRKAFGIVIGCTLLCGLVMAAMLAQQVRPPKPENIQINLDPQTEGVDKPWFELSVSAKDTVQWTNKNNFDCTVSFGAASPFDDRTFVVPAKGQSKPYSATKAPPAPANWPPDSRVYKVYKYSVDCGDTRYFDPGGGMKP